MAKSRVRIANSAVTKKNISKALNFSKEEKKLKFLDVSVEIYRRGIVLSWAAKSFGFGQVTYYLDEEGKLCVDTECMSDDFVRELQQEILKQYKKKKLKIQIVEFLFPIEEKGIEWLFELFNSICFKTTK